MKKIMLLPLLAALTVSCAQTRQYAVDPFEGKIGETDANPNQTILDFDLLSDFDLITSIDLITLRGWPNYDPLGMVVTNDTLVVADARCEIGSIFREFPHWPHEAFLGLFDDFDPKQSYSDCFCRPKYVLAALFYVETDQSWDPFRGSWERRLVAVALMDETHNSVLVSDMKHGPRSYRFSMGHSPDSRVPRLIAQVMTSLEVEYEYLKR